MVAGISQLPTIRFTFSLAKRVNEVPACSNAAQKKTVKRQKIAKAIILSRTIFTYLGILIISKAKKVITAKSAKNNESPRPITLKFNS